MTIVNTIDSNGISPVWRDTIYIAYKKGVYLYLSPYEQEVKIGQEVDTSEVYNNHSLQVKKFKFFRFKDSESTAIYFDSLKSHKGQILPKDSLLSVYGHVKLYDEKIDSFYSEVYDPLKKTAIKTYISKDINDTSNPDTTYIYYKAGMEDSPHNLLQKENEHQNLKAYLVKGVFNKKELRSSDNAIYYVKMEFIIEIENIQQTQEVYLEPYFAKKAK